MTDPHDSPLDTTQPEQTPEGRDSRRLAGLTVVGQLGSGGMGEVYQVEDHALGRRMAAKVLRNPTPEQQRKLILEAQVTGQLEHPNIVPVHVLDRDAEGELYFTMKQVQGRELTEVLADDALGLQRKLAVFLKVCDGVGFAHSKGVIHRDLKPANIMVGDHGEVLVMDWGLAKIIGSEERQAAELGVVPRGDAVGSAGTTQDGAIMGTVAYMPPEQARGEISRLEARSDIYSLGVILYELVCGVCPFKGDTLWAVLDNVLNGTFEPPSAHSRGVPRELEAVVLKAMAGDIQDRYDSTGDLTRDIEAYLEGRLVGAASYTLVERTWKWIRRHRYAVAVLLAVGLTALGALGIQRHRDGQREEAIRQRLAELSPQQLMGDARRALSGASRERLSVEEKRDLARVIGALIGLSQTQGELLKLTGAPADRRAQLESLLVVGRLATVTEDFALAEACFRQTGGLGPSRSRIARYLAGVDRARGARRARELRETREILTAAAAGKLATERTYHGALTRLVSFEEQAVSALLVDRLKALTVRLRASSERALVSRFAEVRTIEPDLSEVDYATAIQRWLAWQIPLEPGTRPSARQLRLVELGQGRIEIASRGRAGSGPLGWSAVLARSQGEELQRNGTEERVLSLVCDVLGLRRDASLAAVPLGRYLATEWDPHRAIPAGVALARLAGSSETARSWLMALAGFSHRGRSHWDDQAEWWSQGRRELPARHVSALSSSELEALQGQARLSLDRGKYDEALEIYDKLVAREPDNAELIRGRAWAKLATGDLTAAAADSERAGGLDADSVDTLHLRAEVARLQQRYPAALEAIAPALERDPRFWKGWITRARVHFAMGTHVAALDAVNKAVDINPDSKVSRWLRIEICEAFGNRDQVQTDANWMVRVDPDFPGLSRLRGSLLEQQGQLGPAIIAFTKAIAARPDDVELYCQRGAVYQKAGKYAKALADYEHALGRTPKHYVALLGRARALRGKGDRRGALQGFTAAIEAEPKRAEGHRERGATWTRADYERAVADYDTAIRLAPEEPRGYLLRGERRFHRKDLPGALADFRLAVKFGPTMYRPRLVRAHTYFLQARYKEAAADFEAAISLGPNESEAYQGRALLRDKQGDLKGALADVNRAIELDPDNFDCYRHRALIYYRQDDIPRMERDLRKWVKARPDDPRARKLVERFAALLKKRRSHTLAELDQAIARSPKDPDAYYRRGVYFKKRKQYDRAVADLDKCIELDPKHAVAHAERGTVRWAQGDIAKARPDFEKATRLGPKLWAGWWWLGVVEAQAGNRTRAIEYQEKGIKYAPPGIRAQLQRALDMLKKKK